MTHWTEYDPDEGPRTNITSKVNYRLWLWLKHTQGKKSISQHIRDILTEAMNHTERDDEN